MDFLSEIANAQESEAIALAKKYVCAIYPDIDESELKDPEPGEQKFVFVTDNDVIYIARNIEISDLMQTEADIFNTLDGINLSVGIPQIKDYQPDNHIMRVNRLQGTPLSDMIETLPAETKQSIGKRLGDFTAQMHEALPQQQEPHMAIYETALAKISDAFAAATNTNEISRLRNVENHARNQKGGAQDTVTLHSDLHSDNILYDPKTDRLSVIDFTGAKSGERYRDFIKPYLHLPADIFEAMKSSYETRSGHVIGFDRIKLGSDTFEVATFNNDRSPFRITAKN